VVGIIIQSQRQQTNMRVREMGRINGAPRKKVGLFLGGKASSGGMFQYAQTILDSVVQLDPSLYEIVIAYEDNAWQEIITDKGVAGYPLRNCTVGQFISKADLSEYKDIMVEAQLCASRLAKP